MPDQVPVPPVTSSATASPTTPQATAPVVGLRHRARRATVDGVPLRLTPLEYDLLAFLLTRPDEVHSRRHLLREVWGWHTPDASRTVDTHVARLRRKLGPAGHAIRTIHRIGYVVTLDDVVVRTTDPAAGRTASTSPGRAERSSDTVVSEA